MELAKIWEALDRGSRSLSNLRRGLWLGILLLYCAASIILPIIKAEGLRAVFAPILVRRPSTKVRNASSFTWFDSCIPKVQGTDIRCQRDSCLQRRKMLSSVQHVYDFYPNFCLTTLLELQILLHRGPSTQNLGKSSSIRPKEEVGINVDTTFKTYDNPSKLN